MNIQLVSSILRSIWAIDHENTQGYLPVIASLLGESALKLEFDFEGDQFQAAAFDPFTSKYSWYSGWDKAPQGSIAVIPLCGPLMKNDQYCGPIGTHTVGQIIKEADASPRIDGIILKIDSPGGTVDGTAALSEIVKSVSKPIISFVDGLMASAALWIGSSANEVIAADKRTQIGSVGVILSFADFQPAFEKLGVKFHSIVADQSTDKTKMFEDIKDGKYDEYKKEVLNPIAEDFIAAIKENRPGVLDDQLTGKVFFASDAIGSLVDHIGNFDFAIQRMSALIGERNDDTNTNSNSNNSSHMPEFKTIDGLIGDLESTEEGTFLNAEQLGILETALLESGNADDELAADLQTQLKTANERISTLEAGAGEQTAVIIADKETISRATKDENVCSDKNEFEENLEAVAKEFSI